MPKISIIVCVYNTAPFLAKCLDSIINQTFQDFEVLLIDDGSTDKSGDICDKYAEEDKRFRIFHHKNMGLAWERQFGTDNARGSYSIHVDSDDWMEPNMLDLLYSKALATNADVIICDFYEDEKDTYKRIDQKPRKMDSLSIAEEMFGRIHGGRWNKLVRQDCFRKWNIQLPNIVLNEDLYVSLSLMLHGAKVAYVPSALYHYRRNENNVGLTRALNPKAGIYAYDTNKAFRGLLEPYPHYWRIYISHNMPWLAYLALYYGSGSAKDYKPSFKELTQITPKNNNEKLSRLAINHYYIARGLILLRKFLGRLRRL